MSDHSEATPWLPLVGIMTALAVFGAAQGLSAPLFTLVMQRQGYSPALIGLSAATMPFGLILSASLVPGAVRLFGAQRLAVGCAILGAIGFIAIGLLQDWIAWFVIRFLLGLIINPLYILGEVWALALAPAARRGRIMGLFNAVMGLGYAVGPLTMTFVGTQGLAPFLIGVAGFFGCAGVLSVVARRLSGFDEEEGEADVGGFFSFALLAPALLVAVTVSAATQQSTYALLPVFGKAYGLPEATLALLVTALSTGNVLLQIPLGIAAERFGARTMILVCAGVTGAIALSLPATIVTPLVWPLLVTLGAVGYGIYTMSLVELGNRFHGRALVSGNAAFALMWGVGGMIGPPSSGALMQAAGPVGLPLVIGGLCATLIVFAIYRQRRRAISPNG